MIFSIVIPVYNDFDRLKLTLNGLNNQNFDVSLFEVIIVNNNSTVPCPEFIGLFPSMNIKIINEYNIGSYAARNSG
ncbi:glycosyltransferase family A protein, partial [uncultured Cyclobacterium sp.]|uniref:glycosyltransferase family 2 protein n=1 Tax=uncultured Cyclobacterium sp. TaxID=453820 RepID=UPI0030ED8548